MKTTYLKQVIKNILWLLPPFFFVTTLSAQPTIGTTTFDGTDANIAPYSIFPRTGSVQGWDFYMDGYDTGGPGAGAIYHSGTTNPSYVSLFTQQYLSSIRISSEDGSEFDLDNIVIEWGDFTGDVSLRSYRDGNFVGQLTISATQGYNNYDVSSNTNFDNIDQIRFLGFGGVSNMNVKIDEITISASSLSIDEFDINRNGFAVYPNPTTDYINVKNVYDEVDYQIIDIQGAVIVQGKINQNNSEINLTKLPLGLYFLKIDNQQSIKVLKL